MPGCTYAHKAQIHVACTYLTGGETSTLRFLSVLDEGTLWDTFTLAPFARQNATLYVVPSNRRLNPLSLKPVTFAIEWEARKAGKDLRNAEPSYPALLSVVRISQWIERAHARSTAHSMRTLSPLRNSSPVCM
jgi:hypothetical protein